MKNADSGLYEYALKNCKDRIYFFSHGLLDLRNDRGETFGHERLESCMVACGNPDERFDQVCAEFKLFAENAEPDEDATFVEIVPQ